jgi:branched-chain amino acid transport system ATP-binding protein
MSSLRVVDGSVEYGPIVAVRSIDLDVSAGRVVGLVGTNGAGKSSLLRAISGLVPFAKGKCAFLERDISNLPAWKRALLGLSHVPEGRGLFPRLSVIENLKAGAPRASSKIISQRFEEVAEIFPLLQRQKDQAAGSLSGGEQQMVAIARALMSEPKIIMLDEPALGLAPIMVEQVAETIRKLAHAGKGILLAEQHVDLAAKCADEIHLLILGKVEKSVSLDKLNADGLDHRDHFVDLILGGELQGE